MIPEVVVPAGALSNFDATIDAVEARGYKRPDRKYLMFADARRLCGIGTYYEDTRTSGNANDGRYASYSGWTGTAGPRPTTPPPRTSWCTTWEASWSPHPTRPSTATAPTRPT